MAINEAFFQLHLVTKFNSIYQQTLKAKNGQQDDKIKEFSMMQSNFQPKQRENACSPHITEKTGKLRNGRSVSSRNKSHLQNQFSERKDSVSCENMEENLPSSKTADDFSGHRSLAKMKISSPNEGICASRKNTGEIDPIYVESSSDFEDIHSSPVRNSFEVFPESCEFRQGRHRAPMGDTTKDKISSGSRKDENGSSLPEKHRSRKTRSPQRKRLSKHKVKTPTDGKGYGSKERGRRKRPRHSNSKSFKSAETKENNQEEVDHVLLTELNPTKKKKVTKQPTYEHDLLKRNIMPLSEALKKGDIPFLPNVQSLFGKTGVVNQRNRTWQTIIDEG